MANTKNWIIEDFTCKSNVNGLIDVAYVVHWRRRATETVGEKFYNVDEYGACSIGEPDANSFIPFNELTEDVVISWVEAIEDVEAIDRKLDERIEAQKNPPIVAKKAPWIVEVSTPNIEE